MKRRTLVWIIIVLITFFTVDRLAKSTRSDVFETTLIDLDTSMVEVVRVTFPADDHPILLVREPQGWIASQGNTSTMANAQALEKLLQELRFIQITRIVTDKTSSWLDFGVGNNQGPRIEVLGRNGKMEDFIIGKGSGAEGTTEEQNYIRLFEQKEVYEVVGNNLSFASMNFEDFRNKHFFNLAEWQDVKKVIFKKPDTNFVVNKVNHNWVLENGTALDSMELEKYLRSLQSVKGQFFADNFDETRAGDLFFKGISFELEGNRIIEVNCYRDSTWLNSFVLHSEQNPELWIESDSAGLYQLFFGQFEQILTEDF